ncbi:MAG TPA: hypothetical protein VNR90_01565, partial [Vicinamibacterales bacterium]|nr:hypothetical protein [Vicinamibacterales bacterium]
MRRRAAVVPVLAAGVGAFALSVLHAPRPAPAAAADREPPLWTSAPRHKPVITASAFADLAERARAADVHVRGEVTEGNAS